MKRLFAALPVALLVTLCGFKPKQTKKTKAPGMISAANPFATVSKLPYHVPDFSKIKDAHYREAMEAGIKEQMAEIKKIAENPAEPTFENTLVAMEKSGRLLARASAAFNMVSGANTNPYLQQLQEDIAPKLSANYDAITMNAPLFKRIETIYNNREQLHLDKESLKLVEHVYQSFVLAGAKLSDADKAKMKQLNGEEATLSARFGNLLVNAVKEGALVVDNAAALAGLSPAEMETYAAKAAAAGMKGKWMISLKNTTQQPLLQTLTNRDTRRKLYEASWNRAEKSDSNDTRTIVLRLAAIRAEKAHIMGFANYAEWKLQDQMAKRTKAVDDFFAQLVPAVTAKARQEASDIQQTIDKQGGGFAMEPYDWDFYAEQVRKEKYDLDENEIKPYFELNNVLRKGIFFAANKLYGLTFRQRKDIPVYQADVQVFEVYDADGKPFALLLCDFYKRDNKNGGAWMDNLVGQSKLLGTKPVIYNVCNFTKPAAGQSSLISFDDVTTMFHEFGHTLHGLFASQQYPTLSGTSVARDFVEFPSQFNEHWALEPTVLNSYAIHYKTGQPIPAALVQKIKNAASFNKGYALTEAVAAASLDMQWHKLSTDQAATVSDVDAFEKQALKTTGLDIAQVPPRYRSSYFLHIWGNGYAAGYYAYQWTKMLEEDAYTWFEENGGMTRQNGQRFREMILSKGNTEDYNAMFKAFTGHLPDIKAMKRQLALPE